MHSLTWQDYNILGLFAKLLVPGMAQADLLLELVMMLSSMAADEKVGQMR